MSAAVRKLLVVCCALLLAAPVLADAPPDTTWVSTFDEEFINWATPHVADFQFPSHPEWYSEVLLVITIGCPEAPGDCDPWDRYGDLAILRYDEPDSSETKIEIGRFITPYDITGGGALPGSCTWVLDVSDYRHLLKDTVRLRAFIESWIGGDRGWLLSCRFAFVHGATAFQPYRVINLWQSGWLEYGNPDQPIEDALAPVQIEIPADAEAAKLRAVLTGHGQGNTFNCAEFCPRQHAVVAAGETFSHTLWRLDCAANECSPQLGTWQYNRAGWCPGDRVEPWDNEVTHLLAPGETMEFDYNVQEYFNQCGPHNPDCVDGETCPDCDYNYTGHTQPGYKVAVQLILYRSDATALPDGQASLPRGLRLSGNAPNPFNPSTTIYYELEQAGQVALRIYSAGGRLLLDERREHEGPGRHWFLWNGRDARGELMPSGVYFYELEHRGQRAARKMLMLQ